MIFTTTYKQVKLAYPFSLRRYIRNISLDGLSILDSMGKIESRLNKPRVQFLYFHHIFKDEETKLEALLKFLAKNHTFISYSQAVKIIQEGKIDKPYISFSSDDGFKCNLSAAHILSEYGAKACFFINPGIIGETDYSKIKTYCKDKLEFPPVEFLNWGEVNELLAMGHEVGSHSMWHNNLINLSESELFDDIASSFEVIKNKCFTPTHFAFPYGTFSHFNYKAAKVVFSAGFKSCASAVRGCHINPATPLDAGQLCIRRDHIILDWETNHIRHFILSNSKKAKVENNFFPFVNL